MPLLAFWLVVCVHRKYGQNKFRQPSGSKKLSKRFMIRMRAIWTLRARGLLVGRVHHPLFARALLRCLVLEGTTSSQPNESDFLRRWSVEGKTATEIAELLQRDVTTVRRRMRRCLAAHQGGAGRPRALTPKQEKKVVRAAEQMIRQADGEWQVTADMVKAALKLKCCTRVIREAMHRHGVYLRLLECPGQLHVEGLLFVFSCGWVGRIHIRYTLSAAQHRS